MTTPTTFKLGRLPHDPARPKLELGPRLAGTVPPNPAMVDYLSKVGEWPIYGNDQLGDCVWAMIGHVIEAASTYGNGETIKVTTADLIKGYSAVTGYNPKDPSTDQGTVIADALAYWQKVGIGGTAAKEYADAHKILAYASVKISDRVELDAALNLFGSLCLGVNFPNSAMGQFNNHQPWDVLVNDGGIDGGHAIHHGYFNTANKDERIVTWGAVEDMTDRWWSKYVEEAWVVITPEWLDVSGHSPEGLDLFGLGEDFAELTGKPNPFPAPKPVPTPVPVPPIPVPVPDPTSVPPAPVATADAALVAALTPWAAKHHVTDNAAAAKAFLAWKKARNF
ncbi:MAG: hypothetical protein JWQ81_1665 [Amycolatopsis sp.]|uniref:hypothetical protein n=1 Tax=Amycolatopsis sp. TaxID=37632 RepID=UPI00260486DE|nr:hypothetical protein [Amycolatopsis sp.]MCU1680926.1 hypothetical protein [Amycolatopsis sp.]